MIAALAVRTGISPRELRELTPADLAALVSVIDQQNRRSRRGPR